MQKLVTEKGNVLQKITVIQKRALIKGLNVKDIQDYEYILKFTERTNNKRICARFVISIIVLIASIVVSSIITNNILSTRCLLPSNFLVWEATRPLANCSYCANLTKPIILRNVTRRNFIRYAYSSKPIIVKNAIGHWPAVKEFSYEMLKELYEQTAGGYESLEEGCQFLNFKSDLFNLKEVFSMPKERVKNNPGQEPWYVGWGNCHQDILNTLRQYYTVPEFLPKDAEYASTEHIFMGYEIGAVMHLDYIQRLMWQGQVSGSKMWSIAPIVECESICHKFEFYVEPLDIVLLDTRVWYHETRIPKGHFSITVQSEYG